MSQESYECPLHKKTQYGKQRETFQTDFYNLLIDLSMGDSMRLYKEVNVACHCQSNYEKFDIIKNSIASLSKNEANSVV